MKSATHNNRLLYTVTDEGGLLTVEYDLGISFSWEPGYPQTWEEPGVPPHAYDISIYSVSVRIGTHSLGMHGTLPEVKDEETLLIFRDKLNSDEDFARDVASACAERYRDDEAAAYESHIEAKFQAKRDGE